MSRKTTPCINNLSCDIKAYGDFKKKYNLKINYNFNLINFVRDKVIEHAKVGEFNTVKDILQKSYDIYERGLSEDKMNIEHVIPVKDPSFNYQKLRRKTLETKLPPNDPNMKVYSNIYTNEKRGRKSISYVSYSTISDIGENKSNKSEFEPSDLNKGDISRIIFYFILVYGVKTQYPNKIVSKIDDTKYTKTIKGRLNNKQYKSRYENNMRILFYWCICDCNTSKVEHLKNITIMGKYQTFNPFIGYKAEGKYNFQSYFNVYDNLIYDLFFKGGNNIPEKYQSIST